MRKSKEDYESEILDIIRTKDWNRARGCNDKNLYDYIRRNRNTDKNCMKVWNHIKTETRDYKSEILNIIETEDWNRARGCNDENLYQYIVHHKDTDKNCMKVWNHIKTETRDYKSEVIEIVETKDWDKVSGIKNKSLYNYIYNYKDTDKNCMKVWNHIKTETRDYKSEVIEIVETKDWSRARGCNDKNLYGYLQRNKDIDENCRIAWNHIKTERKHHSAKDYLQYYFEHGKPTNISNKGLYNWFFWGINNGNQCCIDIRNLIVATENFQDPVAIETLELIKNHLENKEG
jgi:sortase (surface protein transpeptidase)